MIGAGVFSAFGPAAKAAGSGLLVGLAIAAAVAFCNAVASAQLAAQYPTSGGTYVYGRERLSETWGFVAGFGFVVGKTASCAAMALTFAAYAVPGPEWVERLAAVAAVIALTTANYHGISRTAGLARLLVAGSVVALLVVVGSILASGEADAGRIGGLSSLFHARRLRAAPGGRAAVLRVRRLRAHRNPRRGGARPASHDPARDPAGTRRSSSGCTWSSACRLSPPPAPRRSRRARRRSRPRSMRSAPRGRSRSSAPARRSRASAPCWR